MRVSSFLAVILSAPTEGLQRNVYTSTRVSSKSTAKMSLVQRLAGKNLKFNKPMSTYRHSAINYGTGGEACCACYHSRQKTPENSGFMATFQAKSCDTCYVADIHGISAAEEAEVGISLGMQENDSFNAVQGSAGVEFLMSIGTAGNCKKKCDENPDCGVYGYWQQQDECHIITPKSTGVAEWQAEEENPFRKAFPGIKYFQKGGAKKAGDRDADYTVVEQSKRKAVSEWYWTCVEGVPPAKGAWKDVNTGEPPSRDIYMLCSERDYYCPGSESEDAIAVGGVVVPQADDSHTAGGSDVDPYTAEGLLPQISKPWDPNAI